MVQTRERSIIFRLAVCALSERLFVRLGIVKSAAAAVNRELDCLIRAGVSDRRGIGGSCQQPTRPTISPPRFSNRLGSSTNMNDNEVIATRARQIIENQNVHHPGSGHDGCGSDNRQRRNYHVVASHGNLELQTELPLIAYNLLQSLQILANGSRLLAIER